MKKGLLITGLVALVLFILSGFYIIPGMYRYIYPYLDREVSGPVTISTEWQEIIPKEPLKAERQLHYLVIEIQSPYRTDEKSWGIRLADGSVVTFEAQIVDQDGKSYNLASPAFLNEKVARGLMELPKDKQYPVVRIRASQQIKVSRIYWRCYNSWDVS
jgi:hypothetical protein